MNFFQKKGQKNKKLGDIDRKEYKFEERERERIKRRMLFIIFTVISLGRAWTGSIKLIWMS